jgi:hypothetical protein
MAHELFQRTTSGHKDLIGAFVSSAFAAIIIRYVASVGQPSIAHLVLALIAVAGFLAAFLLIGRSNVEPGIKAANVIGAAVVAGACFALVGYLL